MVCGAVDHKVARGKAPWPIHINCMSRRPVVLSSVNTSYPSCIAHLVRPTALRYPSHHASRKQSGVSGMFPSQTSFSPSRFTPRDSRHSAKYAVRNSLTVSSI